MGFHLKYLRVSAPTLALVAAISILGHPLAAIAAFPVAIQYAGRLVDAVGKPEPGPIDLVLTFYRTATGEDSAVGISVPMLAAVPLNDGIFQITVNIAETDLNTLLGGAESPFIQVTDVTHGKTYPRQRFAAIPYALRVPVDDTTITYDANGRLKALRDTSGTIGADSGSSTLTLRAAPGTAAGTKYTFPAAPSAGSFLQTDANGNLTWTTPSGAGDMVRSTYDTNTDGIVDSAANSTQLGGQSASYFHDAANLTGAVNDARLSANVSKLGSSIGTAEIEDGAITAAKLAGGGSVTLTGGGSFTLETQTAGHASHQWASKTSGDHLVTVTNGTQINISKLAATSGYGSWVYWPETVGKNFDLSFRLSGIAPLTAERNIAIAIASDGTNTATAFDRLLIRTVPGNAANNRIALQVGGGAVEQDLTSNTVPNFFDLTDHQILIQVRDRTYAVEVDGTLIHTFTASARTRSMGVVGIAINETFDASTVATLRQWKVIPRPSGIDLENAMRIVPSAMSGTYGALSVGNGPFDGTTVGYFGTGGSSSASGTLFAGNASSGYAGDLANLEVAGTSKFKVDASGNLTVGGTINSSAISGLTVAAGDFTALSSSGYTQTAGNFTMSGTGTFATGTGNVSLNGDTTVAANKNLTLASGTGTLAQTYTGTNTAASLTANSLTSGSIMSLSSNSTAAAAGNTGLNIAISGANGTAGITRYGLKSAITATGATSTNVAGYFSAAGATNNFGLIVENGNVGIGTTAPTYNLVVGDDLWSLAPAAGSKLIVLGNSTGNTYFVSGQDSSHSVQLNWLYNATPANAYAEMNTYAHSNPIRINASSVILQNASGGNVGIGTLSHLYWKPPYQHRNVIDGIRCQIWG